MDDNRDWKDIYEKEYLKSCISLLEHDVKVLRAENERHGEIFRSRLLKAAAWVFFVLFFVNSSLIDDKSWIYSSIFAFSNALPFYLRIPLVVLVVLCSFSPLAFSLWLSSKSKINDILDERRHEAKEREHLADKVEYYLDLASKRWN